MHRFRGHRFAFFLALALILARAAMPFAAVEAAGERGVQLAEICTVYGVAKIAVDASKGASEQHTPSQDSHDSHDAHDCPLGSLANLAAGPGDLHAVALTAPFAAAATQPPLAREPARDAQALWAALKQHGPPRA